LTRAPQQLSFMSVTRQADPRQEHLNSFPSFMSVTRHRPITAAPHIRSTVSMTPPPPPCSACSSVAPRAGRRARGNEVTSAHAPGSQHGKPSKQATQACTAPRSAAATNRRRATLASGSRTATVAAPGAPGSGSAWAAAARLSRRAGARASFRLRHMSAHAALHTCDSSWAAGWAELGRGQV